MPACDDETLGFGRLDFGQKIYATCFSHTFLKNIIKLVERRGAAKSIERSFL